MARTVLAIQKNSMIYCLSMDTELRNKIMNILMEEKKKEYVCHIQYVVHIGLRLATESKVDLDIIETACLLHDIGRDKELEGEEHNQTGRRIAEEILVNSNFNKKQKEKIYECILLHGSDYVPESIEAQIVRSADAGSKVEYHEAFMLMCKKSTFEDRLAWGMKYLNKGFKNISIEFYKKELEKKYYSINKIYQNISNMI